MGSSRLRSLFQLAILAGLVSALSGCANGPATEPGKTPNLIPTNAKIVADGLAPLSYVPAGGSTVYVFDNNSQTLMSSCDVPVASSVGTFIVVDQNEKAILLKNASEPSQRVVLTSPIDISHHFSIWVVRPGATTQP